MNVSGANLTRACAKRRPSLRGRQPRGGSDEPPRRGRPRARAGGPPDAADHRDGRPGLGVRARDAHPPRRARPAPAGPHRHRSRRAGGGSLVDAALGDAVVGQHRGRRHDHRCGAARRRACRAPDRGSPHRRGHGRHAGARHAARRRADRGAGQVRRRLGDRPVRPGRRWGRARRGRADPRRQQHADGAVAAPAAAARARGTGDARGVLGRAAGRDDAVRRAGWAGGRTAAARQARPAARAVQPNRGAGARRAGRRGLGRGPDRRRDLARPDRAAVGAPVRGDVPAPGRGHRPADLRRDDRRSSTAGRCRPSCACRDSARGWRR